MLRGHCALARGGGDFLLTEVADAFEPTAERGVLAREQIAELLERLLHRLAAIGVLVEVAIEHDPGHRGARRGPRRCNARAHAHIGVDEPGVVDWPRLR